MAQLTAGSYQALNGTVFSMRPELPAGRWEFITMWDVSFMVKSAVMASSTQHQRQYTVGLIGNVPAPRRRSGRSCAANAIVCTDARARGDKRTIVEEAPLDGDQAVPLGRSAHGVAGEEHSHLFAAAASAVTVGGR